MQCRSCGTEIADKALICYRCGRATADPKVAPPPTPRGLSAPTATIVTLVAAAAAAVLPEVADGAVLWVGWTALGGVATGAVALWWGGRAGRR
jgi:hypothetical protein